jgi:hypothetical protein
MPPVSAAWPAQLLTHGFVLGDVTTIAQTAMDMCTA